MTSWALPFALSIGRATWSPRSAHALVNRLQPPNSSKTYCPEGKSRCPALPSRPRPMDRYARHLPGRALSVGRAETGVPLLAVARAHQAGHEQRRQAVVGGGVDRGAGVDQWEDQVVASRLGVDAKVIPTQPCMFCMNNLKYTGWCQNDFNAQG